MKPSRRTISHAKAPAPFLKACESQEDARTALMALAESLTFVRVVSMDVQATKQIGEAIEVPIGSRNAASNSLHSHSEERPKLVFVDKFGRCKGPLKIGPFTLVQCPMGPEHPTSTPSVGDLLVGTAVPNTRKSHLAFVLRGWASSALPLWELFRMVRFGTRANEVKARELLLQMPCTLQNCPKELSIFRDEIQMVARLVLFGNLRPCQVLASIENPQMKLKSPASEIEVEASKQIKLGHASLEFIELMSVKLNSPSLLENFMKDFDVDHIAEEVKKNETTEGSKTPPSYNFEYSTYQDAYKSFGTSSTSATLPIATSSYFQNQTTSGQAPPMQTFVPTSPVMKPVSPPDSPKQAPSSPVAENPKENLEPGEVTQAPPSPTFELDDF